MRREFTLRPRFSLTRAASRIPVAEAAVSSIESTASPAFVRSLDAFRTACGRGRLQEVGGGGPLGEAGVHRARRLRADVPETLACRPTHAP